MHKKWIALFSQTGSELKNLQDMLGRKPDFVLSNSKVKVVDGLNISLESPHQDLMLWLNSNHFFTDVIVTLHGYLRIIPPDICNKYEMYNGHPALISKYPELKGKDPQERTWNEREKYPIIGSVVHKVVEGVDEGDIVSEVAYTNRCESVDELFNKLKQSSLEAWYLFLKDKL